MSSSLQFTVDRVLRIMFSVYPYSDFRVIRALVYGSKRFSNFMDSNLEWCKNV